MKDFFGESVLLDSSAAKKIYAAIKDLPVIDYHAISTKKRLRRTQDLRT